MKPRIINSLGLAIRMVSAVMILVRALVPEEDQILIMKSIEGGTDWWVVSAIAILLFGFAISAGSLLLKPKVRCMCDHNG